MWTLLGFVILQCVLYGISLKLLPIWGDEVFTVVTVAESPGRICEIVRKDIHPPLYFLLAHWWNRIPIGSAHSLRFLPIWCLLRFAENPDGKNLVAFAIALAALLYTHYVPGIAVWAGANLLLVMSLRRARCTWKHLLLANAFVAVFYAPWLVILCGALGRW